MLKLKEFSNLFTKEWMNKSLNEWKDGRMSRRMNVKQQISRLDEWVNVYENEGQDEYSNECK